MKKDFDFNMIGKRMPYRTPEGFFDKMQKNLAEQAASVIRRKKIYRLKMAVTGLLCAAAALTGIVVMVNEPVSDNTYRLDSHLIVEGPAMDGTTDFEMSLRDISDEYLEELVDMMEYDIFLSE